LSEEQFEHILKKTIAIMTELTGMKPKGFTAPAWKNHPDQIHLLEQYGLVYGMCPLLVSALAPFSPVAVSRQSIYKVFGLCSRRSPDHSFIHNDFHPYYAPYGDNKVVVTDYGKDPSDWMVPMEEMKASSIVEIPGIFFSLLRKTRAS